MQEITKSFGERTLFENVTLVIAPRERVGLVGRNGMGKSTLFKIILGEEVSDGGEVAIPKNYRIGALEQHLRFEGKTILEEVISALPEDQIYDSWRGEKILFGLGFTEEDLERAPTYFSGGYQIRVKLAKVLVSSPDLLLLDEPTNYLDIVSLRWLKQFLKDFPGEVLMITHDRSFMDDVSTHIMGIHRKNVKKFKGNTSKYYERLKEEEEIYELTRLNQEKKKKELEGFIDRFGAKASKAKQANSRKKQLEKMDTIGNLEEIANLAFSFNYHDIPTKFPMAVNNLSFSYSEDSPLLFSDLNFSIGKNDCIGIIGKNGKGKSTLLNVIAGLNKATSGSVTEKPGVLKGHFGQTNIERLHEKNTVVQEIQEVNPSLGVTGIRGICGAMMFPGNDAKKLVNVLSGGEKARVMLGKIIAAPTNVLLLDEPTNHLDMESIEALCREIKEFPGAVIMVTHSELLLKKLATNLVIFREGGAQFFHGGYSDFLSRVGWDEEEAETKKKIKPVEVKKKENSKPKISVKKVKEEMDSFEESIIKTEEVIKKYEDLLVSKSEKGEDILSLSEMIGKLHKKIEDDFEKIEELQTLLDD
jgi:ATP-binding cassette subfamily F protein 3